MIPRDGCWKKACCSPEVATRWQQGAAGRAGASPARCVLPGAARRLQRPTPRGPCGLGLRTQGGVRPGPVGRPPDYRAPSLLPSPGAIVGHWGPLGPVGEKLGLVGRGGRGPRGLRHTETERQQRTWGAVHPPVHSESLPELQLCSRPCAGDTEAPPTARSSPHGSTQARGEHTTRKKLTKNYHTRQCREGWEGDREETEGETEPEKQILRDKDARQTSRWTERHTEGYKGIEKDRRTLNLMEKGQTGAPGSQSSQWLDRRVVSLSPA